MVLECSQQRPLLWCTDCVSINVYNTAMFILLFLVWIYYLLMIFNKNQTSPHWCLNGNSTIHFINSAEVICCWVHRVVGGRQAAYGALCQMVTGPQSISFSFGGSLVATTKRKDNEWRCGFRALARSWSKNACWCAHSKKPMLERGSGWRFDGC